MTEPRTPMSFEISPRSCKVGKKGQPCECVIAKAMQEKFGDKLLEIQVLPNITTLVFAGGLCQRYATPSTLKDAIQKFDETGEWDLPPGSYKLNPVPKSQTQKAQRERSRKRKEMGTKNTTKKINRPGKLRKRSMNPRRINLKAIRNESKAAASL